MRVYLYGTLSAARGLSFEQSALCRKPVVLATPPPVEEVQPESPLMDLSVVQAPAQICTSVSKEVDCSQTLAAVRGLRAPVAISSHVYLNKLKTTPTPIKTVHMA